MSDSFSPTQGELSLAAAVFAQGDPTKVGILTGDVAVRIFGGAKLPPQALGQIWAIADNENNGWLSRKGVSIAIRLMGHAQHGEPVSKALIQKPGPLPTIEGISPILPQSTGSALKPPAPLSPQDRTKFINMFLKAGPQNGILSGDKARDIFIKSKLPTDKLLQIWNLADTQDRGSLDATDFTIGMYFIQAIMTGSLSFIPTSLPPGLYQQATGTPAPMVPHSTGGSSRTFSPVAGAFPQHRAGIQPQYTGDMLQPHNTGYSIQNKPHAPQLPSRPNPISAVGTSAFGQHPPPTEYQWDVTPAAKASADNFFNSLDTSGRNYIEGDVAVPFMLESKLLEDDLAQIWDLADLNSDGRLTKEGFAVAMHLIQSKLKGTPIPTTLPPTLIPPSMRTSPFSPLPTQSQHHQPAPPPEPQHDLFSWDEPAPSPVPSHTTGSALSSHHTGSHATVVSHSTGAGPVSRQITGTMSQTMLPSPRGNDPFGATFSSPGKSLLDDDDDTTVPPPIEDKSAEIGNVQNQLNSTNKSLENTRKERTSVESDVTNQAVQLATLQTQLSTAKAAYETETKLVSTLQDRHAGQTGEINKTREELIRAESDLSGLRVEKAEIEGSFLRDKEEVRDLHRRMIETSQEVETIKTETEKVKKDAKQQKGRLAIAKKQLSTKEADRVKAEKEFKEAQAELTSTTAEVDTLEAELAKPDAPVLAPIARTPERALSNDSVSFAAAQPLPGTPALSSSKSNNPFERLAMGSNPSSRSGSPFRSMSTEVLTPTNGVTTDAPFIETVGEADKEKEAKPFNFEEAFANSALSPVSSEHAEGTIKADSVPGTPKAPIAVTPESSFLGPIDGEATAAAGTVLSHAATIDSEAFMTPPSTATHDKSHDRSLTEVAQTFPDLDTGNGNGNAAPNLAAPAPPMSIALSSSSSDFFLPGAFPPDSPPEQPIKRTTQHTETDLSTNLKDLEVDESDSDSDDEDNLPLSYLRSPEAAAKVSTEVAPAPMNGAAVDVERTSFDDIFNVSSPPPKEALTVATATTPTNGTATTGGAFGFDSPSAVSESPFNTTTSHFTPTSNGDKTSAGVDVFDEAMGLSKGKATAPSNPPVFSFDNSFDDNFDFDSNGTTSFNPPAPISNGDANPAPVSESKPAAAAGASFDDVFGGAAPTPVVHVAQPSGGSSNDTAHSHASAPPQASPATNAAATTPIPSFDAAFGGIVDTPLADPALSKSQSSAVSTPPPIIASSAFPPGAGSPTSTHSGPRQSKGSSSPSSLPPRASSPTISKHLSPKDPHEKLKEPHRTSKLSIRLPFGRKKKHAPEPVPAFPSHLSPAVEEPVNRRLTPAVDDDVEPVKQLTSMGFSRTQAVQALEQYSYNVPQALNSLLGQAA